jgi:uncharacterized protein (TIGR02271 family)
MAGDMTLDRLDGRPVIGSDGSKIGTVQDIYFDQDTREPEWALVKTGLFGSKSTFVPITNATVESDELRVPFSKEQVKGAPNLDDDGELSQDEEAMLAQHYGMTYTEAPSDSGLPEGGGVQTGTSAEVGGDVGGPGRDTSGPNTDDAMTRSEEELRVGKVRRPSGLVRLRKHIVTEQVSQTVPVERETVRVEREPITDANVGKAMEGPALSEEEHELTLSEEQVVVDKEVVPKERIRLDKDVVVEEQQVTETVAREEIDVDGDVEGRGTV